MLHKTLSAQNFKHSVSLSAMSYDADRARKALVMFLDINKLSARAVCKEGGLSPSAISQFLTGRAESMGNDSYEAIALGAQRVLEQRGIHRKVTVGEVRGEVAAVVDVPIRSIVGAGAFAEPFDDNVIGYTPAPPDMAGSEATMVKGDSMEPLFHDGDLLFHRRLTVDPARFAGEIVVAEVTGGDHDGKRMVKQLLRGTRKARFHLISINSLHKPFEDQALKWVSPIDWIKKQRRRV